MTRAPLVHSFFSAVVMWAILPMPQAGPPSLASDGASSITREMLAQSEQGGTHAGTGGVQPVISGIGYDQGGGESETGGGQGGTHGVVRGDRQGETGGRQGGTSGKHKAKKGKKKSKQETK